MVLLEASRLYPPFVYIQRRAAMDVVLGGIKVPRGTVVSIPIAMLHRDREVWGPDADEFRPGRFANGVAGACKPAHMYTPFGLGPRTCIGQNLAMVELKLVLARLLSRFAFSPSPRYRHAPVFRLTIEPEFGMPMVVTKL